MFYNVENLFDTQNNPDTNDDEFTPNGDRHWTNSRLNTKLLHISKVILSANGFNPPDIVAFSEVENRTVLENLLTFTPLKSIPYKIIHKQSPDHRGIDVALLYHPDSFNPLEYQYYPLKSAGGSVLKTREILFVKGVINGRDTLNIFVNHWPSRYSGLMESRDLRILAAQLLAQKIHDRLKENPNSKIIVLGDCNDQPTDESISKHLKSIAVTNPGSGNHIYNLSIEWLKQKIGTIKYQNQWMIFDQIMVSRALLQNYPDNISVDSAQIVELPFLLEPDKKYGGKKPRRTYNGFKYNGGFSDHLPVLLKLKTE